MKSHRQRLFCNNLLRELIILNDYSPYEMEIVKINYISYIPGSTKEYRDGNCESNTNCEEHDKGVFIEHGVRMNT